MKKIVPPGFKCDIRQHTKLIVTARLRIVVQMFARRMLFRAVMTLLMLSFGVVGVEMEERSCPICAQGLTFADYFTLKRVLMEELTDYMNIRFKAFEKVADDRFKYLEGRIAALEEAKRTKHLNDFAEQLEAQRKDFADSLNKLLVDHKTALEELAADERMEREDERETREAERKEEKEKRQYAIDIAALVATIANR